jgi:hypothetical protein
MKASFQGATGKLSSPLVTVTIPVASHAGAWLMQQICSQVPSPLRAVAVYVSPARASPMTSNPCPGPLRRFNKPTATTALNVVPRLPGTGVAAIDGCRVAVGVGSCVAVAERGRVTEREVS